MSELIIKTGNSSHAYPLREGAPLFAGRSAECDLYLPSPAVSRRHAVFLAKNGDCGLKDLESANGTFLNGKRITKAVRLMDGDVIRIAEFIIEFKVSPQPAAELKKKSRRSVRSKTVSSKTSALSAPSADVSPLSEDGEPSELPVPPPSGAGRAGGAAASETPPPVAKSGRHALRMPKVPPRMEISEEEVGDGGDDAAFLLDDAGGEEEVKGSALNQAAVEAGIVGEFVPDLEEEAAGPALEQTPTTSDAMPLDELFRQAIETRLFLYSFLSDMKREREDFLARRPSMPDAVKSELARQDRELDKIPAPDQAEGMIEKRRAKQTELMTRIREAKARGEAPPPKPSRDMRQAEEMAISQWTVCAQSAREVLPAVYAEGYRIMADEPLADILASAGLDPEPLLGGGAYYLALEVLLEEVKDARQAIRVKMASQAEQAAKSGGKQGMRGLFAKSAAKGGDVEQEASVAGEGLEALAESDRELAERTAWIGQEMAFLEKTLIQEFWRVYGEVAGRFVPGFGEMPLEVRAFLRYGAIGFKKWWMKPEVREHLMEECSRDVIRRMPISRKATNILYVDEYLAAVSNGECTPALDENLEINERNSPNWKADKALRRLINSRTQTVLLEELLEYLDGRMEVLADEAAAIDERIARLLPGTADFRKTKSELAQTRQSYRVEISKLTSLANKIRNETLVSFMDTAAETNARFDSGELPRPTPAFLIARECGAIRKIGRLLSNLKERFLPLVLRDKFDVGTDAVNDRRALNGELAGMEKRDPRIFLETIVPSKKKAGRVDLRVSPVVVLIPAAGVLAYSWNPRSGPEDGRLALPTCFVRRRLRERQLTYLLADFRWDTSKASAGMDVLTSDTIVAAFMTVRWDWRKRSKEAREKGLVFNEQNDRTNWRRVYEAYLQTAYDGGKKLFNRNYDFYERIIGKYFDLPDNAVLLRK